MGEQESGTKNPFLRVDQIGQSFGDTKALVDVSFSLPEERILAILGPSGCGKTTLLRIIAGLQKPNRGAIWIAGQKMNGPGMWVPPQKRSIGMIFQNLALWPHLTVQDNIGLGLKAMGIRREQRNIIIQAILTRFGMVALQKRYPHTLSAGEQQRIALARALVLKPRLLLMDEPFSHLDLDLRRDLVALIKGLGGTMIFVTHNQEDALAIGGLLAIMRGGRLEQIGEQEEILQNPASEFVRRFVRAEGKHHN